MALTAQLRRSRVSRRLSGHRTRAPQPARSQFRSPGAITPVTDLTEHQIRFRLNRRTWEDVRGMGFPLPGYNVGGMSGGPALAPPYVNSQWSCRLPGRISESFMLPQYQDVCAVRAHL